MIRTIISGNDRNDYEGTKMGTIGMMCGPDWPDWHDFCDTVFEGTIGAITASADLRPYFEILLAVTTLSQLCKIFPFY